MLIHTSQSQRKVLTKIKGQQSSKKDFSPKRRIYKRKATMIKVKEPRQQMYLWQRLKMYEHVGKAINLQRRSSDKRQMNNHNNKEQRNVMVQRSQSMKEQRSMNVEQ